MTISLKKTGAALLAATVVASGMSTTAFAHDRYSHGYGYVQHHHPKPVIVRKVRRDNDTAAAIALGVGAIALGAIIANSANSAPAPVYRAPAPAYRAPARDYYPPVPAQPYDTYYTGSTGYHGSLEPWTPGWYRYCEDRYRSFDAQRGTYRGYDGKDHFCIAE